MTVLSEQKGRRVPDGQWFELRDRAELGPGDYGLVTGEEAGRWPLRLWICDKGHVDTSTLHGVCWACFPGGRRTWEPGEPRQAEPNQRHVDVVPVEPTTGWLARCPNGVDVNLSQCHPVTVQEDGTVSVSGSIVAGDWHGYLCRGVWRLA